MIALPRWAVWTLGAAAVLLLGARVVAIYTEAFNWDELALLYRVERSVARGELMGGGRGGLAVLPLLPLVAGCVSEVDTLHAARLVWMLVTTAYLTGVYALVLEALASCGVERRHHAAALGVALLLLAPVFYRWSLQVRTDQIALACSTWAAVMLLRSRGLTVWALPSGLLLGIGYLASQKALYLAALAGLLALADVLATRPRPWAQAFRRAGLVLGALVLTVLGFYAVFRTQTTHGASGAGAAAAGATGHAITGGLETFDFYRDVFGYTTYLAILRRLPLHALLLVLSALAIVLPLLRGHAPSRRLGLAAVVLVLGVLIALFHAGAFAYFWMTLGLFIAVSIALAYDAILGLMSDSRLRAVVIGSTWAGLGLLGAPAIFDTLTDTQAVQRDSYAFVASSFAPDARGFQAEGGLFCRRDPDPFEPYMLETVQRLFHRGFGDENAAALEDEFRKRPVSFILGSQPMLSLPFPDRLRLFWAHHYVAYYKAVMVPGRVFRGDPGKRRQMEVIVPGSYRWLLQPGLADARFLLDGREVSAHDMVELTAGMHEVKLLQPIRFAALVLDTGKPPQPDNGLTFYNQRQGDEIAWARDADW